MWTKTKVNSKMKHNFTTSCQNKFVCYGSWFDLQIAGPESRNGSPYAWQSTALVGKEPIRSKETVTEVWQLALHAQTC